MTNLLQQLKLGNYKLAVKNLESDNLSPYSALSKLEEILLTELDEERIPKLVKDIVANREVSEIAIITLCEKFREYAYFIAYIRPEFSTFIFSLDHIMDDFTMTYFWALSEKAPSRALLLGLVLVDKAYHLRKSLNYDYWNQFISEINNQIKSKIPRMIRSQLYLHDHLPDILRIILDLSLDWETDLKSNFIRNLLEILTRMLRNPQFFEDALDLSSKLIGKFHTYVKDDLFNTIQSTFRLYLVKKRIIVDTFHRPVGDVDYFFDSKEDFERLGDKYLDFITRKEFLVMELSKESLYSLLFLKEIILRDNTKFELIRTQRIPANYLLYYIPDLIDNENKLKLLKIIKKALRKNYYFTFKKEGIYYYKTPEGSISSTKMDVNYGVLIFPELTAISRYNYYEVKPILPLLIKKLSRVNPKCNISIKRGKIIPVFNEINSLAMKWSDKPNYEKELLDFLVFVSEWSDKFPDFVKNYISTILPQYTEEFLNHLEYKPGVKFDIMKYAFELIDVSKLKEKPDKIKKIKDFTINLFNTDFDDFKDVIALLFNIHFEYEDLRELMKTLDDRLEDLISLDFQLNNLDAVSLHLLLQNVGRDRNIAVNLTVSTMAEYLERFIQNNDTRQFGITKKILSHLRNSNDYHVKNVAEKFIEKIKEEVKEKSVAISSLGNVFVENLHGTWIWREYFEPKFEFKSNITKEQWEGVKQEFSIFEVEIKEVLL